MRPTTVSAAALLALLALCGCRTSEGPSVAPRDEMGRADRAAPAPWRWTREGGSIDAPATTSPEAPRPPPRWQWTVDAGPSDDAVEAAAETLPGGLRVAVADASPRGTRSEAHAVEEGVPAAVTVGFVAWPADAPPAPEDASLAGREVRVEWLVSLRARGDCAVDIEAVPRVTGACPVLLEAWRVRRTVPLGQALVFFTEGAARTDRAASALVGAREGAPARFVLRIRP